VVVAVLIGYIFRQHALRLLGRLED
jgi:hypothetical protein